LGNGLASYEEEKEIMRRARDTKKVWVATENDKQ